MRDRVGSALDGRSRDYLALVDLETLRALLLRSPYSDSFFCCAHSKSFTGCLLISGDHTEQAGPKFSELVAFNIKGEVCGLPLFESL